MVVQDGRVREKEARRENYRELEGERKKYRKRGRRAEEREGNGKGESEFKQSKYEEGERKREGPLALCPATPNTGHDIPCKTP